MWKDAIKNEVDSILHNHTWELVNLPLSSKPLGSKWVFKRKMKPDGSIEKYKARLVIKGYNRSVLKQPRKSIFHSCRGLLEKIAKIAL